MFIIQTKTNETITENDKTWNELSDDIASVTLVHPVLNISIGLHGYDRYGFMCEGVMLQQGFNIPRIAEILWGERKGLYVCLRLFRDGSIKTMITKEIPEIAESIWKRG